MIGVLEKNIEDINMNVEEFIAQEQSRPIGYCACLVAEDGSVVPIENGHLNALIEYYGNSNILAELSDDIAPMFWLITKTRVVVVDYENQLYSEDLTQEQRKSLIALAEAKRIRVNLFDIYGKERL